jgi:hypothetical protein
MCNFGSNDFFAVDTDDKLIRNDASKDCEWGVIAFGDLLHGSSVGRIETDHDS